MMTRGRQMPTSMGVVRSREMQRVGLNRIGGGMRRQHLRNISRRGPAATGWALRTEARIARCLLSKRTASAKAPASQTAKAASSKLKLLRGTAGAAVTGTGAGIWVSAAVSAGAGDDGKDTAATGSRSWAGALTGRGACTAEARQPSSQMPRVPSISKYWRFF